MQSILLRIAMLALVLVVSGCADPKFAKYYGPKVTKLEVHKTERVLKVFHHNRLLKAYRVDLGSGPLGHKQFEGDGRTPEGRYYIDRRNPESSFFLSLGLSYPNRRDVAFAHAQGRDPGGDIFIHGQPNIARALTADWTAGCIALTDRQMRELYAMVDTGTIIDLFP